MTNDYEAPKPFPSKGPIILGADGDTVEQDKNINTQELEKPKTSGNLPKDFFDKLSPQMKTYFMEESLKANREQLRKEIIENGKTELADDDYTLYKTPRSGCKHCHGTGRSAWDAATGEVIICECMRRGKLMDSTPDEFMTAVEFMKIFNVLKPMYPREHTTPKSLRRAESKERKLARKKEKRCKS